MKRAIRDHARDFVALLGLVAVAGAVSLYILREQRFRFPLIDEAPFVLKAELRDAQAVTPGQGQTVEVAGVKIGRIGAVELDDGRAVVRLDVFPRYEGLVKRDARAMLRPRTGLKDMFIEVDPGSPAAPPAPENFVVPVHRTLTDVDLDEILRKLDADTRDHLVLLLDGADRGLRGRGGDLAELFERFGPTARGLRRVNEEVAREREALKDAIHGLSRLTEELAGKDEELAELVDASADTFRAFASEDRNVSATVARLPGALQQATRTLGDVEAFARRLGPAADALVPAFRALDDANAATRPFARAVTPVLRSEIRPFVRAARPLVADLPPAAGGLAAAFPNLGEVFLRLNHLVNMLGHNRDGREAPDDADRSEGYLFWLAWVTHQTANLINVDDANGPMRPLFLTGLCSTLTTLVENEPAFEFILNLSPVLVERCQNPDTRSQDPDSVRRTLAAAREEGGR